MKTIQYGELVNFVNLENISLKNKILYRGNEILDRTIYDPTHGLIQAHLRALDDIANLGETMLKYPMGSGVPMMLMNIILEGKGILLNDKNAEIRVSTKSNEFAVSLVIKETANNFSKINISTDRKLTVTENISENSKPASDFIKIRFEALAGIHI